MSQRRVIDGYGRDLGFTLEQLNKLTLTYKVLIDSACVLNNVALSSKSDVKEAIKRAKKLGCVIDDLIRTVDCSMCTWENYMNIKSDYINCKLDLSTIEVEVDEELRLQSP